MASGFFAILDDIAALMDDVAVASKMATKQTAGILGDDLAVNAEKATGFVSSREIPVLWAITKGSFLNKLIIIPIALLLNTFFPIAIKFILILGGIYLAYEGVEKIYEFLFHKKNTNESTSIQVDNVDEKAKIKSAITTDFILSVEIIIIALGSVLDKPFIVQVFTVSVVAIIATIGVYGIVALIVRMDDAGYKLIKKSEEGSVLASIGKGLVNLLPIIIKLLSIIGTLALLLVSGGIFDHNLPYFHHLIPELNVMLKQFAIGLVIGTIALIFVMVIKQLFKTVKPA
jgi:predicted DNA repair protein MutK